MKSINDKSYQDDTKKTSIKSSLIIMTFPSMLMALSRTLTIEFIFLFSIFFLIRITLPFPTFERQT